MADFAHRLHRRLMRELRKRAGGLDVRWDRRAYRRLAAADDCRARFLTWSAAAPSNEPFAQEGFGQWVTPDEIAALVAAADRASNHELDLLGSGLTPLGRPLDWHRDFKSGYRWDPRLHHSNIRWDNLPAGVDIKVPWELSRCAHFATFALATAITGNPTYYTAWKTQLLDWIDANPVGRGVNWSCAMDVAMRAVNWLNATIGFRQCIEADTDSTFFAAVAESLWHHGLHIQRNLEWSGPNDPMAGNHLLADLVGLLAIGAFFHHTPQGAKWWQFARQWIEHEIHHQVNPDGSNFETSTSYHRMVMEMFLWSDTLATLRGDPFSPAYLQQLERMAGFVTAYSAPSGLAAQFGDNDSGRLLTAGLDDGQDHRYLTNGPCGFGGGLNRLLLRRTLPLPGSTGPVRSTFDDSGFHFMRQGIAWAGLRAGPVSHGGAHAHCDQLSFVLNVDGHDVLVDRGTGIYSPDPAKRNRYRSTASHNTVQINGWEQNGFGSSRTEIFQMPDDSHGQIVHTHTGTDGAEWAAQHRGFERYRQGLRHSRQVTLTASRLIVTDQFTALQTGDRLDWHFHFAPGSTCQLDGNRLYLTVDGIVVQITWAFAASATLEQAHHSCAYGVETPATTLRLTAAATREQQDLPYQLHITWNS